MRAAQISVCKATQRIHHKDCWCLQQVLAKAHAAAAVSAARSLSGTFQQPYFASEHNQHLPKLHAANPLFCLTVVSVCVPSQYKGTTLASSTSEFDTTSVYHKIHLEQEDALSLALLSLFWFFRYVAL